MRVVMPPALELLEKRAAAEYLVADAWHAARSQMVAILIEDQFSAAGVAMAPVLMSQR
jgi:hypothetical protein